MADLNALIAQGAQFREPINPFNQMAQMQQLQTGQNQNALAAVTLQQHQRDFDEQNRVRALFSQSGFDMGNPDTVRQLMAISPTQGMAFQKSMLDNKKIAADTSLATAHAGNFNAQTNTADFNLKVEKADKAMKDIASYQSPDEAMSALQVHVKAGDVAPDKANMIAQGMPQDPAQFAQWQIKMLRNIMSAKEQMSFIAPDANTVANNTTSLATNAATNATSRANNAANIAKDYGINKATMAKDLQVAGMAPGGGIDDNAERTARAIASGQLPAPTGMALLNPRNQRILGRVMEINPQYDFTDVTAKKKAASDFTSGTQGNAMRSFAVAGSHLDQLGTLVDALDNGNMQVVNKVGQFIAAQTGSPAPTNFEAAKDVVSKEVIKAIVGAGGGVSERQELSTLMSKANSPAQLKGVIAQYRNLMSAQHDALLQQRRAAGLSDATLPDYGLSNPAPTSSPGKVVNFGDLK